MRSLQVLWKKRQRRYLRYYRSFAGQLHPRMWVQQEAPGKQLSIEELNELFTPLSFRERIRLLYNYFDDKEVLFTSSFGTKSVFILHLLAQIRPSQSVHFIDTTYHFPETLHYKERIRKLLDLHIIHVKPDPVQNQLTQDESWWIEHPQMCCKINKIVPLQPIVSKHKAWISGLMNHQTAFRSNLRVFEKQGDILKFHPIIDIDEGEFLFHLDYYKLPRHPLEHKGYGSIGCNRCTRLGEGRSGRWSGTEQKECGLHPNYFFNK